MFRVFVVMKVVIVLSRRPTVRISVICISGLHNQLFQPPGRGGFLFSTSRAAQVWSTTTWNTVAVIASPSFFLVFPRASPARGHDSVTVSRPWQHDLKGGGASLEESSLTIFLTCTYLLLKDRASSEGNLGQTVSWGVDAEVLREVRCLFTEGPVRLYLPSGFKFSTQTERNVRCLSEAGLIHR